jgi:hypothetical protein
MATRLTPGKPRVIKRGGIWQVFVPQVVFGDEASGTYHGPFATWGIAFGAARAIAGAVLLNVQDSNSGAIQIGRVN